MTPRGAARAAGLCFGLFLLPCEAVSQPADASSSAADDRLILLSVDAASLPRAVVVASKPQTSAPPPQWRTSFGSERRSPITPEKPATAVDADIVMLQGVTDVPTLRRWFPAGQWRLVVSRQLIQSDAASVVAADAMAPDAVPRPPVPTTAIAVRLRRGLRLTGQEHLLELAGESGPGQAAAGAAGTAVRVWIAGRETWAVSVLLPASCSGGSAVPCPARDALARWHATKEEEGARRVTGGRFTADGGPEGGCNAFGLRLDPAPPPPKAQYTAATPTADLGCAATVIVAK